MDMKLAQRVVIGYYRTKLRTIGMLSPDKAAASAFRLFCTPYPGSRLRKMPPLFHKALKVSLPVNGLKVKGFHWTSRATPNGKKVLIVHGFSSQSYKFEKYVSLLTQEGFEVFAFDAPAHGESEGSQINAILYRDTIIGIEKSFGPFDGIIAHSLGALSTTLAMEQLSQPVNPDKKIVLIAPATETTTAFDHFCKMLRIRAEVKSLFAQVIEKVANQPLNYYSASRIVPLLPMQVLWIHDKQDAICPFDDTLPVRETPPQNLQFIATDGLGHNRIYHDKEVKNQVIRFLTDTAAG
ncbi:alpha/beta hydrolase [Sediminibacterium ginsengisoli]|uniref:Alpha/beta hydrolase family protein n=1 Tax=Sediminibacterium ginsengisoli TaxID=413434 RepID=A0A1T4L9T1_9BACT|nr:alpha/beta hydrolase [Sediminibacterium ginsengisoli]SJZ51328.1 Alpha/beta hydrolase family protein [Sediminibacterium ginsengisoli]